MQWYFYAYLSVLTIKNPSTGFCQSCRYMHNNQKLNIWVPNGLLILAWPQNCMSLDFKRVVDQIPGILGLWWQDGQRISKPRHGLWQWPRYRYHHGTRWKHRPPISALPRLQGCPYTLTWTLCLHLHVLWWPQDPCVLTWTLAV